MGESDWLNLQFQSKINDTEAYDTQVKLLTIK